LTGVKGSQLLFVAAGLSLLAVLYVWMNPQAPRTRVASPPVTILAPTPGTKAQGFGDQPVAAEFSLKVKGGALVAGPTTLSVRQGQNVVIHISVDHAEELHLHGYDLKVELQPDQTGALAFTADRTGHFEYELEHSRIELGALDVLPR
jgi:hypothetical protein